MAKRVQVLGTIFANKGENPNVDYEYGPYTSLEAAEQSLGSPEELPSGFTIGIGTYDGELKEYWLQPVDGVKQWVEKGAAATPSDPGNSNNIAGENISVEQTSNGTKVSAKVPEVPIKEIHVGGEKVEPENGVVNIEIPAPSEGAAVDNTDLATETKNDTTTAPSRSAVRKAINDKIDKIGGLDVSNGTVHLNEETGVVEIIFDDVNVSDEDLGTSESEKDNTTTAPSRRAVAKALENVKPSDISTDGTTIKNENGKLSANTDKGVDEESDSLVTGKQVYNAIEDRVPNAQTAITNCNTATQSATAAAAKANTAANGLEAKLESVIANAWMTPTRPDDQQSSGVPNDTYSFYTGVNGDVCKFFTGQMCIVQTTKNGVVENNTFRVAFPYEDAEGYKVRWIPVIGSVSKETCIIDNITTNIDLGDEEIPTDGSVSVAAYSTDGSIIGDAQSWEGQPLTFEISAGQSYYIKAIASTGTIKNFTQPSIGSFLAGTADGGIKHETLVFRGSKVKVTLTNSNLSSTDLNGITIYLNNQYAQTTNGQAVFYTNYGENFRLQATSKSINGIIYSCPLTKEYIATSNAIDVQIKYASTVKNDVGILFDTKNTRSASDASITGASLTDEEKAHAVGIYVYTDNIRVVMSLPDGTTGTYPSMMMYSTSDKTPAINKNVKYMSASAVVSDYNGGYNQYLAERGVEYNGVTKDVSEFPAFLFCKNYRWKIGGTGGHLPSAGEASDLCKVKDQITACLSALGYTSYSNGVFANDSTGSGKTWFWLSTQQYSSAENSKFALIYNGTVTVNAFSNANKLFSIMCLRPVEDFDL